MTNQPETTHNPDAEDPEITQLPDATIQAYDRSQDASVEIIIQEGNSQLTIRHEYPRGTAYPIDIVGRLMDVTSDYLSTDGHLA